MLGLLVVVQLRTQASGAAFAGLSSQDLTVLVANLNARNDQLRREAVQPAARAGDADRQRGARRGVDRRARAPTCGASGSYAGLEPATGQGVVIIIRGPVDGPAVEDLLNELRNAGAEAMAIDGVRVVPGLVIGGAPGEVTIDAVPADDPFEIDGDRARGQADRLADPVRRDHRASSPRRSPTSSSRSPRSMRVAVPATDRDARPDLRSPRL